jgi:hypothetical protein
MKKTIQFSIFIAIIVAAASMASAQGYPTFLTENKVIVATVTNGQAIGLNAPEMRLAPASEWAPSGTVTLAVSRPYPIDAYVLLSNDHAATNKLLLIDSTTVLNLGGDVVLDAGESILLKPEGTNTCRAVSIRN